LWAQLHPTPHTFRPYVGVVPDMLLWAVSHLPAAAGGGQVVETFGKTQRRLDRPGNLGMAMFGWRKNHTTGKLGLYTHSSAEDPATLDTRARK
jgi:hypothetical protein